jgi:uncharacterized protein YndB with AHSA1/START domain
MATAHSNDLIATTPSDYELVWTRSFNAPRRMVFDAWTRPELMDRWLVPDGWTVLSCDSDPRPGGSYRQVTRRDSDGFEMVMHGVYREVERPARLVFTCALEGWSEVGWRPEDVAVVTMELTEQDGRTTWTATYLYPSKAARDAVLEMGMSFENFDRLLVELQAEPSTATRG